LNQRVKTVSRFLLEYNSENTRSTYRLGISNFLKFIYPGSEEDLDSLAIRYFGEARDRELDLLNFRSDVLNDFAPATRNTYINAIKLFFEENDVSIASRFYKRIKAKNSKPITWEDTPTNEQIRRITEYMPIQGKAITLILSSSGMRIGEVVQLKLEDLDRAMDPVRVRIRAEYTKTKEKRITFISPEAKDALLEWLKYRPQYIETANARSKIHSRSEEPEEVFPFTSTNFNFIWRNALDKANLVDVDPKTNRASIRPHGLRKFFRLVVGRHGQDEAEALMGHQQGLNAVYAKFTGEMGERRLREIYLKALPELSIYGKPVLVTEANEELQRKVRESEDVINALLKDKLVKDVELKFLNTEIQRLQADVDRLEGEREETREAIDELKLKWAELEKYLEKKER
jgi:integrase